MKIAPGVNMLELPLALMGITSTIHPTLLFDAQHGLMVNIGTPGESRETRCAY